MIDHNINEESANRKGKQRENVVLKVNIDITRGSVRLNV